MGDDGADEGLRPLVVAEDVTKHFPVRSESLLRRKDRVHSVDGVSLTIRQGETLGLVGETGCGKSTLARLLLGLFPVDAGQIRFDGADVAGQRRERLKQLRRDAQIVFQDPLSAFDPLMTLGQSLAAPLSRHQIVARSERRSKVVGLLRLVGLDETFADRKPEQCSGGQLQRAVIARALGLGPRFLVCDEPTSSLDASIQAQILNLLADLKQQLGLTMLMISHDLRVIRHTCDRVAVMYLGRIVELADRDDFFERARHPYSRALISAALPENRSDGDITELPGEPPSPISPPAGCRFHTRCPIAFEPCPIDDPALERRSDGHWVACHAVPLPASAERDVITGESDAELQIRHAQRRRGPA